MGRIVKTFLLIFSFVSAGAQFTSEEMPAFNYKLDYNIPESPSFSVLGSNPTTVMRGSASQEVIVNLASSFLGGSGADSGLGIDFNPYFVFGGRLKSVSEYRNKTIKRILANTQLSLGTVNDDVFPNDLLLASGIRITLFDSKDPLKDRSLGQEIDKILEAANSAPLSDDDFEDDSSELITLDFSPAYAASKRRYKNKAGGSLSVGAAVATRAKNNSLAVDSFNFQKSQVWLSGQYDFGVSGLSMTGMVMYQNNGNAEDNLDGTIGGFAIRQYRDNLILNAEITYNSLMDGFEAGGLLEYYKLKNILVYASFSYRMNEVTGAYERMFQPGIKWNFSEPKS